MTKQRGCVLAVVQEGHEHLTAGEVYLRAQKRLKGISFATVYNSLHYLTAAGLIGEITFGDKASRFDRRTERHAHALCTACGRLEDFEIEEAASLMRTAARRSRYKPESIHLTLHGL